VVSGDRVSGDRYVPVTEATVTEDTVTEDTVTERASGDRYVPVTDLDKAPRYVRCPPSQPTRTAAAPAPGHKPRSCPRTARRGPRWRWCR
jgi:hypothetical protein